MLRCNKVDFKCFSNRGVKLSETFMTKICLKAAEMKLQAVKFTVKFDIQINAKMMNKLLIKIEREIIIKLAHDACNILI